MKRFLIFVLVIVGSFTSLSAQCKYNNDAFNAGETLDYDLYFNWQFVWVKVGSTHYKIHSTNYQGQSALKTDLIFVSNKRCDKIFPMRDTLVSYSTPELVPLYFRKGAKEGKRYTVDEVWYSYPEANKTLTKMRYRSPDGDWENKTMASTECLNDMLNILALARSYDFSNYKKGQRTNFRMVTGKRISTQVLVYKGKEKFKANNGTTYRTLVFSLLNDKEKKEKELLRFYVTDDMNHLPVRIDFYLAFGSAKAFFLKGTGIRNPQTAIIK